MSRITALIGLLALATPTLVAIGAGALWYVQAHKVIPYEKLDLGEGGTPRTAYVELSAIAHPSIQVVKRGGRYGDVRTYYIPLAPPEWNRRAPIRYFLESDIDYSTGTKAARSDEDGAFAIVDKGELEEMSSDFADSFKRKGLILGEAPVVLNTDPFEDQGVYLIVTAISSGLALITWAIMLFGYLGSRQRRISPRG